MMELDILKPIMNPTETKEFTGLKKRKPTEVEMLKVLTFESYNSMLRKLYIQHVQSLDEQFQVFEYDLDDLDNDPDFDGLKLQLLAGYSKEQQDELLNQEVQALKDDFMLNSFVYDFEHIKIQVFNVVSFRVYEHPDEGNLLACSTRQYYFCGKCEHVHAMDADQLIHIP
jgi:hypothetical protein